MKEKEAINLTELGKLCCWLATNNFRFTFKTFFDGAQIVVYSKDNSRAWDAVCHSGSYGHEDGLLEIMGCIVDEDECGDTVRGWLTANDVIEIVVGMLLEDTYPL
jgi:hypothetical protein